MKKFISTPWFPVCLLIAGLVAGYSVTLMSDGQALAAVQECLADQPH